MPTVPKAFSMTAQGPNGIPTIQYSPTAVANPQDHMPMLLSEFAPSYECTLCSLGHGTLLQ